MATTRKNLKKNVEGFRDAFGIFHPIRSGSKEQGRLYDGQAAGDNDDIFDKMIRREKNQKLAEEIYEKRMLNDALDSALGEERKISLSQFVRKSGGLKYDPKDKTDNNRGELRMLSFAESKRRGIAHPKGKRNVDNMREQANEAGYQHTRTEAEFLDLLDRDMRTGDVLPFFSADYMTNPTTPASFWTGKAREIGKAVMFFKKRNKTAKANKLEKARQIAVSIAAKAKQEEKTVKTAPKTKKRMTVKTARQPAKKAPAKRTATKRPRKNGIIETAASLGVAAVSGLEIYDRVKTKKPVNAAKTRRDVVGNPSKKKAKAKAKAKPKRNRAASQNADYHEREFNRFLNLIEKGDYAKTNSAKLHGKLAGFSPNEIARSIQYARLTHKLQKNPTLIVIKEAEGALKLKPNGRLSEAWARRQATKHYARQLRLEAKLKRAKDRRAKAESKARRNPAKKRPVKNSAAFEAFQGRPSTKTLELATADVAPKHLYCLGRLWELRLKGHADLDFRNRRFYVCADERNKQIWIAGGSIAAPDATIQNGFSMPIAEITHIIYETHKAHLDDVPGQGYIHKFGEEGGARPSLARDNKGFPIIVGGDYTITSLGIAD